MWEFKKKYICPKDTLSLSRYKEYRTYYRTKYDICKEFAPKRILEIGVRAGYSAFAFLSACRDASYVGIDAENGTHGGRGGPWMWWAKQLLKDFDAKFIKANSQDLSELPDAPYDFIHVDGDHTTAGAIHDMVISFAALSPGGIMLVDDYDYLKEVRKAVDKFRADNPNIHTEYRKSLRGEILFRKD